MLLAGVALARLLAKFPDVAAWMSFSCRDGMHNCQGEPLAECIDAVEACSQIVAIGVNCTPPQYIAPLIEIAATRTSKPIVVYPNSGERYDASEMCWHGGSTVATFADHAGEWFRLGARLIGGCCRTTPEDIRALRVTCAKAKGSA